MIAAVTFICVRMLITASSKFSQAAYIKIILGSGSLLGKHYWLQVLDQHVSRVGAYSPWDSSVRQAGAKCFEYINLMKLILLHGAVMYYILTCRNMAKPVLQEPLKKMPHISFKVPMYFILWREFEFHICSASSAEKLCTSVAWA